MLLVLDTNEYLFAFGAATQLPSVQLLDWLTIHRQSVQLRVPRLIVEEIRRNVSAEAFREVLAVIHAFTIIDEDVLVPFELGAKYERRGLKPADAFIAAYAEWVGASVLISENRHFLTRQPELPFQVMTAQAFLDTHLRRPRPH